MLIFDDSPQFIALRLNTPIALNKPIHTNYDDPGMKLAYSRIKYVSNQLFNFSTIQPIKPINFSQKFTHYFYMPI